jgi:hypothetical protein
MREALGYCSLAFVGKGVGRSVRCLQSVICSTYVFIQGVRTLKLEVYPLVVSQAIQHMGW